MQSSKPSIVICRKEHELKSLKEVVEVILSFLTHLKKCQPNFFGDLYRDDHKINCDYESVKKRLVNSLRVKDDAICYNNIGFSLSACTHPEPLSNNDYCVWIHIRVGNGKDSEVVVNLPTSGPLYKHYTISANLEELTRVMIDF